MPIVAASLSIALTGPDAHAECSVERVGQWGGASCAVAVQGDFAYAGLGAKFIVLDISDPQSPALIGSILTRGTVIDLALSGELVYVCTDSSFVEIVNISSPAQPTLVGEYQTVFPPKRVILQGTYAYVLSDNIGLHVVDISDPSAPVRVGQYNICCPFDMAVFEDYLYILSDYQTVLLDVAKPAAPVFVAYVNGLGDANRLIVSRNRLYATWGFGTLVIFDISTPTAPALLGFESLGASTLEVADDLAYVTTISGLVILDVSNPADPAIVGQTNGPQWLTAISTQSDLAVLSDRAGGVSVVDVWNPQSPQLQGEYRESGPPWGIAVSGTQLYLTSTLRGPAVHVLNLANPIAPTLVGESPETIEPYSGLMIRDEIAYLAGRYEGLFIYDVSNPSAPVHLGELAHSPGFYGIVLANTVAYLISDGGLFAVDVADPSMPTLMDEYWDYHFYSAEAVATIGSAVYVAATGWATSVIDAGVPTSLTIAGTFPGSYQATDIMVSGSRAYVQDYEQGLVIYDVSEPLNPVRLSNTNELWAYKLSVHGEMAYQTGKIVDVSDPAVPAAIASFGTPGFHMGYTSGVDVLGSYLYVASTDAGVTIFRTCIAADANCDSRINGLDVAAFSEALLDPSSYQSAFPFCNVLNADVDESGGVDEFDIIPFVERVLAH